MPQNHPIRILNQTGQKLPFTLEDIQLLTAAIEENQDCMFAEVELVYVHEEEIVRVNREFLQRDYVTDIISFRYDESESNDEIEGSLVCCAPRITEQAGEFGQTEKEEFLRIFVHGMLHLIGYDDDTESKKNKMTELENYFLAKLR